MNILPLSILLRIACLLLPGAAPVQAYLPYEARGHEQWERESRQRLKGYLALPREEAIPQIKRMVFKLLRTFGLPSSVCDPPPKVRMGAG